MTAFELHNATLSQGGVPVLTGIDLTIGADEKVALLGRSGVGKTTLLSHLYQQAPEQVALCPQAQGLVEPLSVYHNIYMGQLARHGRLYNLANLLWPLPAPRREIAALCQPLGLEAKLMTPVAMLSGGQRQRVALGRALCRNKPTFIGDEPVSALDPVQGRGLLDWVLSQHRGAIVALHDVTLAQACFDRVIGLADGRILWDRPTPALTQADLDALYL